MASMVVPQCRCVNRVSRFPAEPLPLESAASTPHSFPKKLNMGDQIPDDSNASNSSEPTTSFVERTPAPLLRSEAARQFRDACDSSATRLMGAIAFVQDHAHFSNRDCADVFLVDQAIRWSRSDAVSVESYLSYLATRSKPVAQILEWELIAHEYELRQAWAEPPSLRDVCLRFPAFAARLTTRFAEFRLDSHFASTVVPNRLDPLHNAIFDDEPQFPPHAPKPLSLLATIHPFDQLPTSIVQRIEAELQPVSFEQGQHLIRQGALGDGLFVIVSGKVEIRLQDEFGASQTLCTCGENETVGEMSLLTDEPRTADVVAVTSVEAKYLPLPAFEHLAAKFASVSRVLTLLLADRLGQRGRDVLAGKTLSQYRIIRRLGKGGMAIVYQAVHVETGQVVALKMMSHRLVYDADSLKMFQQEAHLIESFQHRNIVAMHGRFEAFRSFFIVLEYCSGESLEELLKQAGPLSAEQFRSVIAQVAAALDFAHSRQVVHRDIKPSNIMLGTDGVVKLMDFGLANPIEDMPMGKLAVVGTPQFMAPEQLRGELADQRADYFALGCTAYKLLTGNYLVSSRSIGAIRRAHANWQLPELPGVPDDIAAFVKQCLPADARDRNVDLKAVAKWR